MKDLAFADLRVGMSAHFEREFSEADLDSFAKLSGDQNPLHQSTSYAEKAGFPSRVTHGMLSASLYSALVGMHLPGQRSLLRDIEIHFLAPLLPGQAVEVQGEIVELHPEFQLVDLRAQISLKGGSKISRAKIRVGLRNG